MSNALGYVAVERSTDPDADGALYVRGFGWSVYEALDNAMRFGAALPSTPLDTLALSVSGYVEVSEVGAAGAVLWPHTFGSITLAHLPGKRDVGQLVGPGVSVTSEQALRVAAHRVCGGDALCECESARYFAAQTAFGRRWFGVYEADNVDAATLAAVLEARELGAASAPADFRVFELTHAARKWTRAELHDLLRLVLWSTPQACALRALLPEAKP